MGIEGRHVIISGSIYIPLGTAKFVLLESDGNAVILIAFQLVLVYAKSTLSIYINLNILPGSGMNVVHSFHLNNTGKA